MAEIEMIQRYEDTLSTLFKSLKLKGVLSSVIRALVIASEGVTDFELSHSELGKFYCPNEDDGKRIKEKVAYAIKNLNNWQGKNKCELVRITKGRKQIGKKGNDVFIKSRYRFVLLSGFIEAIGIDDREERRLKLDEVVKEIREQYKPPKPKKKYIPRKAVKRAKETIYSKFEVIYELANQIPDWNPEGYCKSVLKVAEKKVQKLQEEYDNRKNVEAILRAYDELASSA